MEHEKDTVLCIYEDKASKYIVSALELDEKSAMITFLKRVSGGKGRLPNAKVIDKTSLTVLVDSASLWEALLKNG